MIVMEIQRTACLKLNPTPEIALRFVVQRQLDVGTGEAQSTAFKVSTEVVKTPTGNCTTV